MSRSIYYTTNKKPSSKNNPNCATKIELAKDFGNNFKHLYSDINLPLLNNVITYYLYVCGERSGNEPDIDNLSKPLVDAFCCKIDTGNGNYLNNDCIYTDDKVVVKRIGVKIILKDYDPVCIDYSDIPHEVYKMFSNFINNNEKNIVLFKVSQTVDINSILEDF